MISYLFERQSSNYNIKFDNVQISERNVQWASSAELNFVDGVLYVFLDTSAV